MNYKILFNQMKEAKEAKLRKPKYQLTINQMNSMIKFVAAVPIDGFMDNLKAKEITASDKETILGEDLMYFVAIVSTFPMSFYLNTGKMTNQPIYNSAVPYIMYCHRLHNQTPYESWRDHPNIKLLLGKHHTGLLDLTKFQSAKIAQLSTRDIMHLRSMTLMRAGKLLPNTSWNCVLTKQDDIFDSLPKCVKLMTLQTWMLNGELRNKYMILNPFNWDNMPDVIDIVAQKEKLPWE